MNILNNIYFYQDYILSVIFISIIINIILITAIKKFKINSNKTKLFGIFLELDNRSIVLLSTTVLSYIFTIFLVFKPTNENYISNLIIMFMFSLVYMVFNFKFKTIFNEIISVIFTFISVVSCNVLYGYIFDIQFEYIPFIIYILIFIFVFLYSTYNLFRRIYDIMHIDKYVRKVRGE